MNPKNQILELERKTPEEVIFGTFVLTNGTQLITGYFDIGDSYLYCVTPRMYIELDQNNYTMKPYNRHAGSIIEALKKSVVASMAVANEADLIRYKEQSNKDIGFDFYRVPVREVEIPMRDIPITGTVH